ncbi:MAG: hypothetical protein HY904_06995 [Deltaproteobacteria bacterium]|nr:hypothetical protein [Deltaproteobacteria bacterium]
MSRPWLPVLAGTVLLAGGALLPTWAGTPLQSVALLSPGHRGDTAAFTVEELRAAFPAPHVVTLLSPGAVEVRAPGGVALPMAAFPAPLDHPLPAPAPCPPDEECPLDAVAGFPPFQEPLAVLDPPRVVRAPAPRALLLAAAAAALLGIALLVLGLARVPPPGRGRAAVWMAVCGLAGAVVGVAAAFAYGRGHEQVLVLRVVQRPRLPWEPLSADRYERTRDAGRRVESAPFTAGMDVEVHAIPLNATVIVHAWSRSEEALRAFTNTVRTRVLAPERALAVALRDRLSLWKVPAAQRAERDRMLAEVVEPALEELPVKTDGRSPLNGGLAGALCGALLAWVVTGRRIRA